MRYSLPLFFIILLLLALLACNDQTTNNTYNGPLRVVCTTGMIGDAVQHIAGSKAKVRTLMRSGVDPHLYKATQGDLELLTAADVIFFNGLHLEGKMTEVLRKLSRTKRVIALADSLPSERLMRPSGQPHAYDPHVWFDVSLWREVVLVATRALAQADPIHQQVYHQNAEAYLVRLDSLHQWVQKRMAALPPDRRVLVTAHDAFGYFGRAYQAEVRGLQGISTASEYGLHDVSALVDFLTQRRIKAIFVESSVPAKALEAVVEGCARRGHVVAIGGQLYSDALGETGTPAGTYEGMVRANVETIVKSLQ